jgi:hypothetical protein
MTITKVTGDVVVMNILTGLIKLRDENGNEHKLELQVSSLRELIQETK